MPPSPIPTLTVLSHPDLQRVGDRSSLGELLAGRDVALSRMQPNFLAPGAQRGRPLEDRFVSRKPLRIRSKENGVLHLDPGESRTRLVVHGEEGEARRQILPEAMEDGVVLELAGRVTLLLHYHRALLESAPQQDFGLIGASDAMDLVRMAIEQVAAVDIPVLLRGETGTGKELVARALHSQSGRHRGSFVGVNLGALTASLAVAELFGARKGAFTGAVQRQEGYFGKADGGTLFLDEIGEAPAEIQVMLLRALETGEVVPVGEQSPQRRDVRILSATDADLEELIGKGRFRAPLLHRLAGFTIQLPPLRRRRDDIGRLVVHFAERELARLGEPWPPADPAARVPWLPAPLMARLALASWPGNVRQLRNLVRQLVIAGRGLPTLAAVPQLPELLASLDPEGIAASASEGAAVSVPGAVRRKPSEVSEEELVATLKAQRWNIKEAAEALAISRTSLYALIERSPRVRTASAIPPEEIRDSWERHGGALEPMVEALEVSERALRQRLKDLGLQPARR